MMEGIDDLPGSSASSSPVQGPTVSVTKCQDMILRAFEIPMVKLLKEHVEKSGCAIGDNFVKAVNCHGSYTGGYTCGLGIIVCADQMSLQDEVNQVVIHELTHAYDDCRVKDMDWANCAHHACSEIRAGRLSGDCHYKRELLRGSLKIRGVCQKKIANPYCSETAAREATEAVWDACYNDTKPFDSSLEQEIYIAFKEDLFWKLFRDPEDLSLLLVIVQWTFPLLCVPGIH